MSNIDDDDLALKIKEKMKVLFPTVQVDDSCIHDNAYCDVARYLRRYKLDGSIDDIADKEFLKKKLKWLKLFVKMTDDVKALYKAVLNAA